MDLSALLSTGKGKLALGLGAALLLIVACLACGWGGYRHGRSTATADGEAKLAKLQKAEADAWAESKAKALDRYETATLRADALATEHREATKRLAANRTIIVKEIAHATAGLDSCAFGPDFLRTYNRALGLGSGGVPDAAGAGGPAGSANATAAADAGVRQGAPVSASPADLLTHLADYGAWCWSTADQRDKLLKLYEEAR
jgi:serine phosphatase RsbU (regulator of sigma subunit)